MNQASNAEPTIVGDVQQIVYEFTRAQTLEGWWVWALLVASMAALLFACIRFYRRDVSELSTPIRIVLVVLRITSIVALIFFFFDLQRRTQRLVTRPSEIAILVDTSQSMSLPTGITAGMPSRTERAEQLLADSDLLEKLSQEHRVNVYAFGDEAQPRLIETRGGLVSQAKAAEDDEVKSPRSEIALFGAILVGIGVLLAISSLLIGVAGRSVTAGWCVVGSFATLLVGILLLGSIYSIRSQSTLVDLLGVKPANPGQQQGAETEAEKEDTSAEEPTPIKVTDWDQEIAAAAIQSRIGDGIRNVLADHDPATLAGIILISDGQSNGGSDASVAVASAKRSDVAIYPIGLGSSDAPVNVRIVDLDAPRRVYPGDKFAVAAVLQGSGPNPIEVEVQLLDGLDDQTDDETKPSGDKIVPPGAVIDSQKVKVNNDGTLTGIRFELEPESVGRRRLAVRVVAPEEDRNDADDVRDARYEVVSRKLRVLAVAGGPTREYRFVRNLLFRDNSIELDAWLQTGQPGISQDVDRVLQEFPSTAEELFQYDAVILFDPDWTAMSAENLDMIDRWLTQQAGGMILVAGPVYHPQWSRRRTDPRVSRIAGFFPVNVSTRGPLLAGGRQGGELPWPLKFTPEARRAEFLWIAEDPEESFRAWEEFDGVYDYVDVKSAKPGAKVYAYFSDPTAEIGGSLPVFLASQFYGAGRVFFQASGEMWRLRGESDAYFQSYYTKLVRWVSEGRLLRDSNRGILLVDSSRAMVGDTITVRAVLTDEQFEPLDLPEVPAKLLAPGGLIKDMKLLPLKGEPRAGTYGGRFVVREAGSYEIRLTLGDALDEQVLRQSVQVRLPTVELERPRRNDEELEKFASNTGGQYLAVTQETTDDAIVEQLKTRIRPQPQTTILPGTPDEDFNRRRNATLMWLIGTMLTMEWVTRRLNRLA
ncbi:MAG: VWA domain-containing protein [Planctomycetaceae bacterium]|nr:VWA domain-containing protein [Planctomycetaceae bacterium]